MKICFWNSETGQQDERDATPEEISQAAIDAASASQPVVPRTVTRRQALQALLISGVTIAMIEAAIAASGMTELQQGLALIELHESLEFERNRPLVISIGAAMSLDLDDLFILAGSL